MRLDPNQPIGIFDSGIGGLTVAKAVISELPNENIIYFGDTAHFPYGDKSLAAIQNYAIKITEFLLTKKCKLILIACNSASAAAYKLLQEIFRDKVLIINVIDPLIEFLATNYQSAKVGLIATKLTVSSNIYNEKLSLLDANIDLYSRATPLITAVIEEGLQRHEIVDQLLSIYLNDAKFVDIKALVLACTHYPLIKDKIKTFYKNKIDVVDASTIVAETVRKLLAEHKLLHTGSKILQKFYISDYTDSFVSNAKLFLGRDVDLEHYPLWDLSS
jgi:glutamate racemase